MITDEQHRWIEQLLEEGQLTQQQIAELTGIGRSTVQSIAIGRRQRLYFNPCDEPPVQTPVRCAECGGLIYPPCQLCRLRRWQRRRMLRRRVGHRARGATPCRTKKRCGGTTPPKPC